MTSMNRVRVGWSGWPGQPGLSTFYLEDQQMDVTAIKTFFTALAGFLPGGITWTIPSLGDKIADTDGSIAGSWVGTGGGQVVATGSNSTYSGVSGFCVDWKTATIHGRRRIQGRTFFVPATIASYQGDGTIADSARTTISAAASALVSSLTPKLLVWSRPVVAPAINPPPGSTIPIVPRDGASGPVVAAFVPDMAIALRSRRV